MELHWDYHGRINRKQFWFGLLFILLIQFVLLALFSLVFSLPSSRSVSYQGFQFIEILLTLTFIWPAFCLGTKRFHDCDLSGWWCILNLIPYIGVLITLGIQGFMEGTKGKNRFGNDPSSSNSLTFYGQEL